MDYTWGPLHLVMQLQEMEYIVSLHHCWDKFALSLPLFQTFDFPAPLQIWFNRLQGGYTFWAFEA